MSDESEIVSPESSSPSNIEEIIEDNFRRTFTIPKKIKQAKIFVTTAQGIMGIILIVLPILYFVNPAQNEISLVVLAIIGLVFGTALVGLLPTGFAKAINSKLILGKNSVSIRNHFGWKIIPWRDLQEILITEKLSSDPNNPKSIGITLIRFRTISKNAYFMAESYPSEEVRELKISTKEAFARAIDGTDYIVSEKTERPAVRSRFIYYYKALASSLTKTSLDKKEEE